MKHLNFSTKSGSQSGSHRVVTLAATVGSPSVHRQGIMLKLLSVLVLIFTFGIGQMWGADPVVTITRSSVTSTGTFAYGNDYNWSQGAIAGKCQITANNSELQFNGGKPNGTEGTGSGKVTKSRRLWNTTPTPTRIKSIKLTTGSGTARNWKVFCGTTAATSTSGTSYGTQIGSEQAPSTSGTTWTIPDNANYTYFMIYETATSASYLRSVEITYEAAGGCDKSVTLAQSVSNGTATFTPAGPVATCSATASDRQVSVSITPTTGYALTSGPTVSGVASATISGSGPYTIQLPQSGNGTLTLNATCSAIAVTGVSLNKNSTSIVEGSTETLTATIAPSNALDQAVTWYSNAEGVATVSNSGVVTAVAAGNATITVTTHDGSFSASCTVTVTALPKDHFIDDVHSSVVSDKTSAYNFSSVKIDDKSVATSGSCEQQHYHFVGWITKAKYDAGTAISNSDIQTGNKTPNNSTYYAVWAKQGAGGGGTTYTLVTEASQLATGDRVVLVDGNPASTCNGVTGWNGTKDATISTTTANWVQYYVTKSNDNWTLKDETANKFIKSPGSSNEFTYDATTGGSFAADEDGWVKCNNRYLAINGSSYRFYTYTNINNNSYDVFYMYKVGSNITYTDYIAKCCSPLGTINGSVSLTTSGTSATIKNWSYNPGATSTTESNINKYTVYLYSSENSYASSVANADCTPANRENTGVTFNNLSYANTYKIKITATGNTGYCGIDETSVSTINTISTETFQLPCVAAGLAYGTTEVVKTFGNDDFTNTLTNSHNLNVSYEVLNASPSGCVTVNNTGSVHIVSAGTATIKATSAEQTKSNVKYCAGEASYSLTVNKLDISPSLLYASTSLTAGGTSAAPTISGNAGNGTVSYAVTAANPTGCATVNETTGVVTAVAAGSATITATIGTTTNYNGNTATANFTISAASQCAAPTFSVNTGTYVGSQNVTISSTSGATIYYTTDGSDPTSSGTRSTYLDAFAVNVTTTIRAYAVKDGMSDSEEGSATITIQCAAPTFDPTEGSFTSAQNVTISSEYGTVYYTTDGSDPTTYGEAYSEAISVEASTTIRAIAKKTGCTNSELATATYELQCVAPTISPAAGAITGGQEITLSCETEGAKIYYSTDGNDPTIDAQHLYDAEHKPVVSSATTIKAVAVKDGWTNSSVASAAYTIQYTVTWKVGGVALSGSRLTNVDVLVNAGGKVSKFPSVTNDELSTCIPEHCTFMGWSASEHKTPSNDAPSDLFSATDGTIPTVSANATYYAVFAEVVAGDDEWVETPLANLTSSDVFVMGSSSYAMPNNGGTSAPTVQSITVQSGKITSTVTDALKWNVSGNATNGYTFYPNGSTTTWLYCSTTNNSGSNNNIAVGTGNRKVWELNNIGYLITKDNYANRYLSIYNNSDFRSYVNTDNGVFVAKFYKKTSTGSISDYQTGCCQAPKTALSITGLTTVAMDGTLSLGTTGGNGGSVTWSVTDGTGSATISNLGVLTPGNVGKVTVTAHQDETDGKCEQNPTVEITIVAATVHATGVDVTPEAVALLPGETIQLTATVAPNDATDKSIKSWGSGTTTTATVSASGLVTAVAKGTSTVTATTNDGDFTDNCAVTVHGLTILKQDEDGTPISAEGVTATATGKSLSASATAASKYVFKGWSYKTASGMTGFADATNASTTMTGTPTGDVVVIAEFYKPRVIKWSVNNDDTFDETTVAYGGSISSVPAVTSGLACASTFVAWTDAEHNNGETPTDDIEDYEDILYTAASDFPTNITVATTTYYAVFANASGKAGYFYIGDEGVLEKDEIYIFVNSLSGDLLGNAKALKATTLSTVYNGSTGDAVDVTITSEPGVKYVSTFNEDLEFECTSIVNADEKSVLLEIVKNTPASNYNLQVNGSGVGRGDGRSRYNASGLQGWNTNHDKFYDVYYNSTSDKFTKAEDAGARVYAYKKQTTSYAGYVTQCDMTKAKLTYVTPGGVPGCEETEVIFTKETEVTICGTQPTPPTGYQFKEWNTATNGSGDAYAEGATIPATKTGDNITLTAQWTPVTYNITYHLDGGTNGANPATYTIETADIELVAATKGHDRFDGWFTDNGVWENQVTTIALGSHENIELYAKWTSRYEIQFKAADVTVGTIWRAADEELNVLVAGQGSEPSVTAPSLCGKMFAGWTKNQIEDIVEDAPADFMEEAIGTVNSNTIFYAVWADATSEVLTKVCDWESASIPAIWKASDEIVRTNMQGYDGTYAGRINTEHTYVQYNQKVNATEFSFAFVKTSGNDNYYVYIETSPDNSNWTAAETYEMSEFINGTYKVKTKTFDGLSKMYVRFHCYNTTAERYVDAVTIKYNGSTYTNYTTACHVTAENTQTVNVTEANTISSLTVKQGGKVNLDANLTVTDFTIEAMEGFSGQVLNPNNLQINGNAYYDLTLNTSGTMDNTKWYAFAVPFQVDAATGIQRLSNDGVASNAGFNSHYRLLKYNSAAYASSGQGWSYMTSGETLYPGKFYMIALNSNAYNRVRMTKKADAPVNNKENLNLTLVGTGVHANWNALANNALAYANVSATGGNAGLKVQVYNSATDQYIAYGFGEVTFTVGTPFFFQAAEEGTMNVEIASMNNETVKAPAREAVATGEFQIRLGANTESYYDILYVSASDEALNEYQIGHDLAKAGVSTTVPQMYVPAYDAKLCDAEFPLVNSEATFPLTFTAPNAGTYQLYVAEAATDAELFLTKDGAIIWNLTMSAYALELEKGTTENYGLLLKVKDAATGVEQSEVSHQPSDIQKIIINDNVFILRGGQMYDVTGKAVK